MIIEKTIIRTFEFPDEEIDTIADDLRDNYDERILYKSIRDYTCGWDDCDYYEWDDDDTEKVAQEIKRRIGGIQLEMNLK